MTRWFPRILALAALSLATRAAAGPGSGTASIAPSSPVVAGSAGKWSVVFTAAEDMNNGRVTVTIPAGWTAPQSGSSTSAGYVTVSTTEPAQTPALSIGGQVVTIDCVLTTGNTVTLVYGDDAAGANPGARANASTSTGSHIFAVASRPSGVAPAPIAASPGLTVIAETPESFDILPNDTTVTAGDFAPYRIRVLDSFGNPSPVAENRTVGLFPGHGQFFLPSNHGSPITQVVIPAGTTSVRVDYRPTLATGGTPHALTTLTIDGKTPFLGGVDEVNVVPGALSTAVSSVSATGPVTADGVSQSTVTVTARDAFGNARAGDTVVLGVTGDAVKADPGLPTGANGQAVGAVTDTKAENVTVSATVNGQLLAATAVVTFEPGPVSAAISTVDATTPVVANGTSTSTITVAARDAFGNAVAGETVTLSVEPSANAALTQPGGVTGAGGTATGTLASTATGSRKVRAVIGSTAVIDSAVVVFNAGSIAAFTWTVDGAATAGTAEQVTLTARDAQGHVVTGYTGTVNLATTSGGVGDAVVEWSAPAALGVITNLSGDDATYQFAAGDNGVAVLRVTDTRAEAITLSAQDGAAAGTSGSIVVAASAADQVQLVAGNGQSATVNTAVATQPRVRVVDAFGNSVVGATVTFRVVGGGGGVDVVSGGAIDSTGATAADGTVDCDIWRMGTIAGLNRLRVLIASGSVPSVDFTATGTAGAGANLVLAPGSKGVTVGSFEVVTATLTDAFGNAKGGERVDIVIKSGLNGTLAEDPVDPGTTTALNPLARWGNTDAAGRVTVRWVAPAGAGLADVLDASTSSIGQGSVSDVTYTTTASGATNLRITFIGNSTAAAGASFDFLVEAVDGNGNLDATNTSTVTLTPEAGSGLVFSLTDFGATITQAALVGGQRTFYARGTLAGNWDIGASGGGLGADTDAVTITDTGVVDHYDVSTVASVVAGVTFNVSVVARDQYNNLVAGAGNAVTLSAVDDANPSLPAQSVLQVANAALAAGQVVVPEAYTKAEAIRVKVTDSNSKQGVSGILTVSAAPAKRIAKLSGDATGVAAGAGQALTAQVFDAFDNPVAGESVTFTVLEGGGSVLPLSAPTNASGVAATTLTTGAAAGDNRVKATIQDENPAGLERADYLVQTVAGGIAYFTVVPQKYALAAGELVSLTVSAFDAGDNLVAQDNTTAIQLTHTGSAQLGATAGVLTAGVFVTTVADTVAETFTVTAAKSGGLPPSNASAPITVGNAGAYRVVKIAGDASGVTAGAAHPLEVEVRDAYGNPVGNALVTFSIGSAPDGSAFFEDTAGNPNDGITVTNASGRGTVTYHTAQTSGANVVNAQILDGSPAARERVSFTVNTAASAATKLRITFLGPASAAAGQSFSFKVEALDASNNVDTAYNGQVTLTPEGGSTLLFSLTDFGATLTQFNLQNGTRTLFGRGTKTGGWDIAAAAAGLTGDTDVVTITDSGVVDHYAVTAPDSVIAGAAFNVSVEARDVYDNKVVSAVNNVNLSAVDDANPALPAAGTLTVAQATLVGGAVVVNESYTVAELIRVKVADAGAKQGVSGVVKVKPAAAYRVTNVSGDGAGIVAGATRVLTARVLDPYNNVVAGQLVSFAAVSGGGSMAPPSAVTGTNGQASATLTTGTVAGANVARASILDSNPAALETADFSVGTVAGPVASYEVTPAKTNPVAGETIGVTVRAKDANGNYRTQDNATQITLSQSGSATLGATAGTLTAGQFVTTVRDTVAQAFTVGAQTQGGGPSGTSPVITVSNGPAYRVVEVSGSGGAVPVGSIQPLRTEVRDQWGNKVSGVTVAYLVTATPSPASYLRDSVGDSTDGIAASQANGRAVARLHLSNTAGLNTVTATILDGTPVVNERVTFNVTTVAGGIHHYDVVMSASSTTAGVSKNVTVTARDINNNLVDDDATQVVLSGDPGTGLVFGANPVTLSNGVATTSVTANLVQSYQVRAATSGNPSVTGLSQAVSVVPAAPAGVISATASQNTITANATSTTTITSGVIVDAFGNQVAAGLAVNVSANLGGVIVGGSPKSVGANGRITFDLRSSTGVGTCTVTMTSATGTASGTIPIAFAPPPVLACDLPPVPAIVVPGASVSFTVAVDNGSPTAANLTTATTFSFTDGTRTYTANLAAPQTVPGNGSVNLVFAAATIAADFVTAQYAPVATLIGSDAHASPVNVPCDLPALSLLVTSIEITGIVPSTSVVSRGQSLSVAVTVKNNGAQNTTINDVDLVFVPAGLFTVTAAPEIGQSLAPGASGVFNLPVTVQASATVQTYQIDASATGTVGGAPVVDNAVSPHPRASLQVTAAASLAYEPGTFEPAVVSRGDTHAFELTIRNNGGGLVFLDSALTRLTFTDGVRTYSAAPSQHYAIAGGGALQTMTFRPRAVAANFAAGSYPVTLDAHGTENAASFEQMVSLAGSPVTVQTPAAIASAPGDALEPDQVSKTATVAFTVQLTNSGGATVNLTPATTTLSFAAGAYVAALNPSGPTSLPPGTTTLLFLGAPVSGAIATGTYNPTVQLNGVENGVPFTQGILLSDGVVLQNAPAVAILAMLPSQASYTQDQAKPVKVRMVVANSGGAAVTFTAASMRFIHAGLDRSGQFVVSTPASFAGGAVLAGGETDTVVFDVADNAGNSTTVGNMTLEGALEVEDVNTTLPVFADTDLGGKGNLLVQSTAAINVMALIPSQTKVTQGMNKTFQVRAVVRNTGGSDVALALSSPSTRLVFAPAAGWASAVRPALAGGGTLLSGGETDTLVFDVTTSGSTAGLAAVDVVTAGTESNSGKSVPGLSSGLGSLQVQTPGVIQVASVVPSRASITNGAGVAWTVTVTLTNTGQADVNLALGGAVGVTFQNASVPPSFTVPATLAGGGTVLSGGETDQFVVAVATAGSYTSAGSKSIGIDVDGVETNSGAARNGAANGAVLVQQPPDVAYVSLVPPVVSKGASVAFAVTVTNPVASGATLTLDRAQTRLRFGASQFNAGLTQASPVDVPAGAQVTLLFSGAVIGAGIPVGPQADAQLDLQWTQNGAAGAKNVPIANQITVQDAPDLSIISVRSSRSTVTRQQTVPWSVTMVVRNAGGADVALDLGAQATRLGLALLGSGANVTGEYTIQQPAALEFAGGNVLAGGATDSLVFDVTQAGVTAGAVVVNGFVRGTDLNSSDLLTDDTTDGGSGNFTLQTPGALSILSITPAQNTATVGQTARAYSVKMAVRNTGGASVDVSLLPANSFLSFPGTGGWAVGAPTMPSGVTLAGGETDTLRFQVTTTGGPAGVASIAGTVSGVETNTGAIRGDDTASGGTGSITLQTPAVLSISSVTPSQATVTAGTAFGWDVTVAIANTGQSSARLILPAGFNIAVQDDIGASTVFVKPLALEEGGIVLAGGASGTLVAHANNTGTFASFGQKVIATAVNAVEINSDRGVSTNANGSIRVQKSPDLRVVAVRPGVVTSGSLIDFEVDVENGDASTAAVVLDRGATRVHFAANGFSAFLKPTSPDSIPGGITETLFFESKIVPVSIPVATYDFNADFAYNANEIDLNESETVPNGVTVQEQPQLVITQILASQNTVTAGQAADWTATMTVTNNGTARIDLDLAPAKTRLTFIGPDGQPDNSYVVSAPFTVSGDDTLELNETEQIVFNVTQTGTRTGNMVISGRVEGRDLNQSAIVTDDTFDGGRGSIVVQPAAAVAVSAVRNSQPRVTAGQSSPWAVRVVVANTGGADVDLDLAGAGITFSAPAAGWTVGPATLIGGGTVLEGGAVDSLLFTVTATDPAAGLRRIDASVPWTESNSSVSGTATTGSSGFGTVTVQTPPVLRVTTTTVSAPNPAEVNTGQAFAVVVQVQNTGQADAHDVALSMVTGGASAIGSPLPVIAAVPGNQTVAQPVPVTAAALPAASETFTSGIASAHDANSGQSNLVTISPPLDATATVAVQTPALFEVTGVRPSQPSVTRSQANPWSVIVSVRNTGQADADLTAPADDDLGFSITGLSKVDYVVQAPTAFGSGTAGWRLAGGAVDSLVYDVISTGNDTGTVDLAVSLGGTDRNEPARAVGDDGQGSVRVQDVAGLVIAATVPVGTFNHATANRDTVNTGFAYEIHVTVDNSGETVDSVLVSLTRDGASTIAPASLRRQAIDADASHTFVFRVTSPAVASPLETFTAGILPGVVSRNSGEPVTPQPPLDNTHLAVTQTRASLVTSIGISAPPEAAGGVVSTNQVFEIAARVSNTGDAGLSGPAALTLTVPAGFSVLEPLVRAFAADDSVKWTVTAPAVPQAAANFTAAITATPDDRNTAAPAFVAQASDAVSVAVSTGGALTAPAVVFLAPAGAQDDTLSVAQSMTLRATVNATGDTRAVVATLTLPAGFSVVGSPVRNLGDGTGGAKQVDYNLLAPATPVAAASLFVTFTATDANSGDPVPAAADTLVATVVPRASLAVAAAVTAPADAVDNTVAIGTPFTVTATVANPAGAAGIGAPGTLTVALPAGYALAQGETAAKPFSVAVPVSWVVNAPAQPSGPDQINVTISAIPADENSGQPAQVTTAAAAIAMVTEGAAVSVRDVSAALDVGTGVAPGGADDLDVLAFAIAYNVSDANAAAARIDTIAVTLLDADGSPLGPTEVAQTLARVAIVLGGAAPYEVADPAANPVVISLGAGGAERNIAPDGSVNAVVYLDLDANPRVSELRVGVRAGGVVARDAVSGQLLGVTDAQGRPLDGQITSAPLVVLSSSFEEYAHNYPNPFRAGTDATRIAYFLESPAQVNVKIYAMTGDLVFEETIPASDPRAQAGPGETTWDGRNMSGEVVRNGVYVCVLNAGSKSAKFRIAVAK